MAKSLPVLRDPHDANKPPDPDLPPFQEARLDRDGLDCLLADLDDLTELVEIRTKSRTTGADSPAALDLLAARQALLDGQVGALQIIYRFADRTWCDTLIADGSDTRLLRFENPMRVS